MAKKVVYSFPNDFDWGDRTNNLLLNMSGGLLPKDLKEYEIELLRDRFGPDWFAKLGYSEPEYERPKSPATCVVMMISMLNRLEEAINFAVWAHRGQLDKVGRPYILHPLHVMLQMNTESERIIAVLHDVLEDCPQVELSDVVDRIQLTEEESKALVALTHLKNEP